LMLSHYSW